MPFLAYCAPLLLGACSQAAGPTAAEGTRPAPLVRYFTDGRSLDGSSLSFAVAGGKISDEAQAASTETVDLDGHFVVPAFIDSHVHLAYDPRGSALLAGGVVAAVDLAAPLAYLESPDRAGPELLLSGPMLTALQGYPTQSWGADGYGWELRGAEDAVAAVETLDQSGAALIKFALAGEPALDDAALSAAVARAHELGLRTAAHAVSAAEAERAALAGIDVLAHTPTEALPEAVLDLWSERAVISTLSAFGGPAAAENLRRLQERGATVLYGTDFGNTQFAGIQPAELSALASAGLDAAAVIDAGTSAAAHYWNLPELGGLTVGQRASFLVLDADPARDLLTLSRPLAVYIDGVMRSPAPHQ
jgi:imidazolonepropionase-like amidohydrolase